MSKYFVPYMPKIFQSIEDAASPNPYPIFSFNFILSMQAVGHWGSPEQSGSSHVNGQVPGSLISVYADVQGFFSSVLN